MDKKPKEPSWLMLIFWCLIGFPIAAVFLGGLGGVAALGVRWVMR